MISAGVRRLDRSARSHDLASTKLLRSFGAQDGAGVEMEGRGSSKLCFGQIIAQRPANVRRIFLFDQPQKYLDASGDRLRVAARQS